MNTFRKREREKERRRERDEKIRPSARHRGTGLLLR
jgi:hypothetical protein